MIALALALADPPMPEEIELFKCFYAEASMLDDHISSAAVIAQGVVSACAHEVGDWKYAVLRKYRPVEGLAAFFQRLDGITPGMATEVVLRVRAAQKAKK